MYTQISSMFVNVHVLSMETLDSFEAVSVFGNLPHFLSSYGSYISYDNKCSFEYRSNKVELL